MRNSASLQLETNVTKSAVNNSTTQSTISKGHVNGLLELVSSADDSVSTARLRSHASSTYLQKERGVALTGELERFTQFKTLDILASLTARRALLFYSEPRRFPLRFSHESGTTISSTDLTALMALEKSLTANTRFGLSLNLSKSFQTTGDFENRTLNSRISQTWSYRHSSVLGLSVFQGQGAGPSFSSLSPYLSHSYALSEISSVSATLGAVRYYGATLDRVTYVTYSISASRAENDLSLSASFGRNSSARVDGQNTRYLADTANFSLGIMLYPGILSSTTFDYRREVGSPFPNTTGELINGWVAEQSLRFSLRKRGTVSAEQLAGVSLTATSAGQPDLPICGFGLFYGLAERLSVRSDSYGARAFVSVSL